jgi:hypothetical protein
MKSPAPDDLMRALASSRAARMAGLWLVASLLWMGLVWTFSDLSFWAIIRSGFWNGAVFLGAWSLARRFAERIAERKRRAPSRYLAHAGAALVVASIWTLLSEATGVALTDWFLEGRLEEIAFFDWIESRFDAAEAYFDSDAGWLAYRFVLGLSIYALAIVVFRVDAASVEIAALERRVQLLDSGDEAGAAESDKDHFIIRDRGRAIRLPKQDIELLEGERDYVRIHTPSQQYLVRFPLRKFEAALDGAQFLRVHRSRIVNIDRVETVTALGDGRAALKLANGREIETSRQGGRLIRERAGRRP